MTAALDDALDRYRRPLLRDGALQERLRRSGYACHEPILDADDLRALRALAHRFLDRLDEPWGDLFLAAGRIADAPLREEITTLAMEVVRPRLEGFFVEGTEVLGSTFQVKPPSRTSELNPHQDSSLVDERTWLGVYAWIPLVDADERNGGLRVLPGSHRFGNLQRTLNVPWQLAGLEAVLERHSRPVPMPAGGVVFFDAATVHGSPPNRSDQVRIAANHFAKPAAAPMVHFFRDETTTPGTVELYEIDVSFFLRDDIMARPGPRHRFVGEVPQQVLGWSEDEFELICRRVVAEADAA